MVHKINETEHSDKIGIVLAPILSTTATGGAHHRAEHDYTRDIKLQGENYFGNPNMAQLYLIEKAWPLIEAAAKTKPHIDIEALRARHNTLLTKYKRIGEYIRDHRGIRDADIATVSGLIQAKGIKTTGYKALLQDALLSKVTDSLCKAVEGYDTAIMIGAMRGGSIGSRMYGPKLKRLEEKLDDSIKALKSFDLDKYNPRTFTKLYSEYQKASNALYHFISTMPLKGLSQEASAEDAARQGVRHLRLKDKLLSNYFERTDPVAALKHAYNEYVSMEQAFYLKLEQKRGAAQKSLSPELLNAHNKLLSMLEFIENTHPEMASTTSKLRQKHIEDKMYLEGMLNAEHVRHENPASDLVEETFDHRALWTHLETEDLKEESEAFKQDLYNALPIAKTLSTSLGQGYFNITDVVMKASLNLTQISDVQNPILEAAFFNPSISKRHLNVTFGEDGKPTLDLEIEYDFLLDAINKLAVYADKDGALVAIKFDKGKYKKRDEIFPHEVKEELDKIKGRQPIASIHYNLTLDAKDSETLVVSKVNQFELSAANNLKLPEDVHPDICRDNSFKQAFDKGLPIRALMETAKLEEPQAAIALDHEEQNWSKTKTFHAHKRDYKRVTKALEESEEHHTSADFTASEDYRDGNTEAVQQEIDPIDDPGGSSYKHGSS